MTRTHTHSADAPPGPVTPVELFFDVVFVFTLTQLTHTLEGHLSLDAMARLLLIFGVLWWMYGGCAWLTNHVPPRQTSQKLLLFTGMAGFLIAAVSIPHAFDTDTHAAEHALSTANMERRSRLAMRTYFFAHIPVLLGIIVAAAAFTA